MMVLGKIITLYVMCVTAEAGKQSKAKKESKAKKQKAMQKKAKLGKTRLVGRDSPSHIIRHKNHRAKGSQHATTQKTHVLFWTGLPQEQKTPNRGLDCKKGDVNPRVNVKSFFWRMISNRFCFAIFVGGILVSTYMSHCDR